MEQLNRLVCTESGKKEGNERRGKWTERKRQSLEMKEQVCGREVPLLPGTQTKE